MASNRRIKKAGAKLMLPNKKIIRLEQELAADSSKE
jgi:hypothetical protein